MTYNINRTELEDFIKACEERGLSEYDFTINGYEVDEIMQSKLSGKVVISRGNITKEYDPSRWAGQCVPDIKAGIFD